MHEAGISDRYRLYASGHHASLAEAMEDLEPEPRREDIDEDAAARALAATCREHAAALRQAVDPTSPPYLQWQTLVRAEELEDRAARLERGE